jgi:hypothetical protein
MMVETLVAVDPRTTPPAVAVDQVVLVKHQVVLAQQVVMEV